MATEEQTYFVFIKIPAELEPLDRTEYEDELNEKLEGKEIGFVSGGGTMLSTPDSKGERKIEFCGIDVEVYDLTRGIKFLKKELKRLKFPQGTTFEFRENEKQQEIDIYEK
jgi:hypothetical protein